MRAALGFALSAALIIAGAWWLAGLPGSFTATIQDTTIQASIPVALALIGALFVGAYLVLRLIAYLFGIPQYLGRRGQSRQRTRGEVAVNRTLVALAAGDADAARREADRGRRLLGDTPLTLMLTAQASRQAGREEDAEAAYRALASRRESAFLGLRGLLRQAMVRGNWQEASELARKAEIAYPNAAWLREERLQLALHTQRWADAMRLAPPSTRASLAVAAADAATDPREGRRLAKQAFEADPALAPAAIAYAARLRAAGKEKAALDVLRRAWTAAPHPDLGDAYLATTAEPGARLKVAEALVKGTADHAESRLLLARLALDAGQAAEARRHAEAARDTGLNQRRLWLLMADIAEAEDNTEAGRDALRFASVADPDPAWQCEECGTQPEAWKPVCPHCGTPGGVRWGQPKNELLPGPSAQRNIPRLAEAKDIEGVP